MNNDTITAKTVYPDGVVTLECAMRKVHYIPKYQRDYDWGKAQCESLFEDLMRFSNNPDKDGNSKYVFGQIVCYNSDENKLYVLDGQQRLTTSTLLIAAIRNILKKISTQVTYELYDKIVELKLMLKRDDLPLLNVYKPNQHVMDTVIDYPDNIEELYLSGSLSKSQYNIIENYNYFFDSFCKLIGITKDDKNHYPVEVFNIPKAKAETLINYCTDFTNFKVCELFCAHLGEAYEMFETINNRGIPLKSLDLLKNQIYSKCYRTDSDLDNDDSEIEQQWKEIVDKLGNLKGGITSSDKYLRYYTNATIKFVRTEGLYEELIRSITNYSEAISFINTFTHALEFFKLVTDSGYLTSNISQQTKRVLTGFNENVFDSYSPMALSVYLKNHDKDDLDLKLRATLSVYDRFYVLNVLPHISKTSKLEEVTSKLAIQYYKSEKTLSDVLEEIESYIQIDETIKIKLSEMDWNKTSASRYVLSEIFNRTSGSDCVDISKVNIEHILPKSPKRYSKYWPEISEEIHTKYVSKLGNLLLLNCGTNSKVQDREFSYKKEWYLKDDEGKPSKRYSDINDS